jgi:uncharacterized OsmC-like protein
MAFNLRDTQKPLKERYRQEPGSAIITLIARSEQADTPIACSVDLGRAIYEAQAHLGVGGAGTAPCSGDLLLGALAACAQLTTQMVAEAMGIKTDKISITIEGDWDIRGTLGIDQAAPVGLTAIRATFEVVAPEATPEQIASLKEKAEKYCVVLSTLRTPPPIETSWK